MKNRKKKSAIKKQLESSSMPETVDSIFQDSSPQMKTKMLKYLMKEFSSELNRTQEPSTKVQE